MMKTNLIAILTGCMLLALSLTAHGSQERLLGVSSTGKQDVAPLDRVINSSERSDVALSPVSDAWKSLTDDAPSKLTVEYWTTSVDAEACQEAGFEPGCSKVCRMRDRARSRARCDYREARDTLVDERSTEAASGYVCTDDRCVRVTAKQRAGTGATVLQFDDLACVGGGKAVLSESEPKLQSVVVGVIPPLVWDWITGGNCCPDCWGVHRSLGLPCWADYACCMGACGVEPGCGGGGGGGSGNVPPDDGGTGPGNGSSCGASYEVAGATVEYNGQTCNFDGTVNPTWIDGECMDLAGAGVIYGCSGEVLINDPDDVAETEAPEGF